MYSIPNETTGPPAGNDGHAAWRLAQEIVSRSVAEIWHDAKCEWALESVFFSDPEEYGACLCGHYPIREHCLIRNRFNGSGAVVGNVCVARFLTLPSEAIFAGLRRVARDPQRALSQAAVEYAYGKGLVNDWERQFYLDTARKRTPSPKVVAKRVEINERVLRLVGQGVYLA